MGHLNHEFGKDGITVNNVGPGFTATERLKHFATASAKASGLSEEEMLKRLGSETAVKRVGEPDDFAAAAFGIMAECCQSPYGLFRSGCLDEISFQCRPHLAVEYIYASSGLIDLGRHGPHDDRLSVERLTFG